jgi:hypothetical protein
VPAAYSENNKEIAQNACYRFQCVLKKTELDSEYLYFDEFPERRFELAAKIQTETLPGDLQNAQYLFIQSTFV